MPNKGRVLMINGKIAQCMAQAMDAIIPNASKFIFGNFIWCKVILLQQSCKNNKS